MKKLVFISLLFLAECINVNGQLTVGKNVTATKPEGDVVIEDAGITITGKQVELHPGTFISNSNVIISP